MVLNYLLLLLELVRLVVELLGHFVLLYLKLVFLHSILVLDCSRFLLLLEDLFLQLFLKLLDLLLLFRLLLVSLLGGFFLRVVVKVLERFVHDLRSRETLRKLLRWLHHLDLHLFMLVNNLFVLLFIFNLINNWHLLVEHLLRLNARIPRLNILVLIYGIHPLNIHMVLIVVLSRLLKQLVLLYLLMVRSLSIYILLLRCICLTILQVFLLVIRCL